MLMCFVSDKFTNQMKLTYLQGSWRQLVLKYTSTINRSMLTKFINNAHRQTSAQYYSVSPKTVPQLILGMFLHASWPDVKQKFLACLELALIALQLRLIFHSLKVLDSAHSLQTFSHLHTEVIMDCCWPLSFQWQINNLSISLIHGLTLMELSMPK